MAAEIDWLDAYLPIAPCELGRSVCGIRNGGDGLPRRPRSADFVAKVENPTTSKDLKNPKGSFCLGFRMPASEIGTTYTSSRRPKAAKERTRGGWGAENAANSAMGDWLMRRV